MPPILRVTSAPSEILKTILDHIGLNDIHRHPEYDDDDIIDLPGEGGDIGGPPRSGVFIVIMVFGFVAVVFTIVAGWIWCAAANGPLYSSERDGRRRPWKAKRMVPFKDWYRRRRGLPRTKSDRSRDSRHHSFLDSLSAANWRGRISRRVEPDHTYKTWRRTKETKFWREHGHLDSNAQFNPRSLLSADNRNQSYSTFSKEAGLGGAHILSLSIPTSPGLEELFTSVPYSPLVIPVPPLRRPPLGAAKGRAFSTPSRLTPIADRDLRLYQPRSNSWSGFGSGPRGRSCKYTRRGSGDFDGSGRRSGYGGGRRGCSKGIRVKSGGVRGLDVVEEEETLSGPEK